MILSPAGLTNVVVPSGSIPQTMAGMPPVEVGCEMLADDGGSLSREEARAYAEAHDAPFLDGSQIIGRWRKWSG